MNDLLTEIEIIDLTGAIRPSAQKSVLDKNGIYYIVRKDKTLRVTWHHIHHPYIHNNNKSDEPNFDALQISS
jgi:hypothetical protein